MTLHRARDSSGGLTTPDSPTVLSSHQRFPSLTVFPGLGIMMVVLATQLLGDWLRIRLDPQLRNL